MWASQENERMVTCSWVLDVSGQRPRIICILLMLSQAAVFSLRDLMP